MSNGIHDETVLNFDLLFEAPLSRDKRIREAQKTARAGRTYGMKPEAIERAILASLRKPLTDAEIQEIHRANPWLRRKRTS